MNKFTYMNRELFCLTKDVQITEACTVHVYTRMASDTVNNETEAYLDATVSLLFKLTNLTPTFPYKKESLFLYKEPQECSYHRSRSCAVFKQILFDHCTEKSKALCNFTRIFSTLPYYSFSTRTYFLSTHCCKKAKIIFKFIIHLSLSSMKS